MCHSYGIQVIADIKLNDIPSTNETALEYLIEEGFDAVIANPIIGRLETINLAKKAHSLGAGILAIVYMSHPGASQTYGCRFVIKLKRMKIEKCRYIEYFYGMQKRQA